LCTSHPRGRIDLDALHRRKIDHQSVLAYRISCHTVRAAADREWKFVVASELNAGHDVVGAGTSRYQCRAPVDHRVEDLARRVVSVVAGTQQGPTQSGLERGNRRLGDCSSACGYGLFAHLASPPAWLVIDSTVVPAYR
jgi:hypothetical protein